VIKRIFIAYSSDIIERLEGLSREKSRARKGRAYSNPEIRRILVSVKLRDYRMRRRVNEIIDVDTRSDDNHVLGDTLACARGSSVCVETESATTGPVKGFPLSNNTVLLHDVPLLYFTARALRPGIVPGIVTNSNLARLPLLNVELRARCSTCPVSRIAHQSALISQSRPRFSEIRAPPKLALFNVFSSTRNCTTYDLIERDSPDIGRKMSNK